MHCVALRNVILDIIGLKSGRKRDSALPYKFSLDEPATTKSVVKTPAPIRSIAEIYGVPSALRPAITGSQK